MTCKEKIDEIEKILDDEYETKIERIREVVDDAEDKAIPLDKIKKAREEISDRVYRYSGSGNEVTQAYCDGFKSSLEILDKLIESEEK